MKFIAISDTHGMHYRLPTLPKANCIIHAGDVSNTGKAYQIDDFFEWFADLDYEHKIFIAGNHDFWFEQEKKSVIKKNIPKGVIYLNDSGVTINEINIWGSPVSPWFYDWAFNRQRGKEIDKHWQLIPNNTNLLITHGPAFGVLDKTIGGQNVGCDDLLMAIENIKPKVHICGHIHEAYGLTTNGLTTYINACMLNERYEIVNHPIEFEL